MGPVLQNFPSNTHEMGGYSLSVELRTRAKHALAASNRHGTGSGLFSPHLRATLFTHLNISLSWKTPLLRQRKHSHSTVSLTATNTSQSMTQSTDPGSHRENSEPAPQRRPFGETLPVTGDIFSDMPLEARSRDPQVGPTLA